MTTDVGKLLLDESADSLAALKVEREAKVVATRFGDLLESMPDGIVVVNSTGRIVLSNSQAQKLFGYETAELKGAPIELLLPKRYHGAHVAHRTTYFSQPRTRTMGIGLELYGVLKDGSTWEVYKRFFTGEVLAVELGGGETLYESRWFVAVRS
jgi:PAS domain S-box-containing protein